MAAVLRNSLHRNQLPQPPAGGGKVVDAVAAVATPMPSGKRQPVILKERSHPFGKRCGEAVGGTAAECAAVCCCFPCGVVSLLVLTVVKLPAALCRRVVLATAKRRAAKKRRAAAKSELLSRKVVAGFGGAGAVARPSVATTSMMDDENDGGEGFHRAMVAVAVAGEAAGEVAEMEKEMLAKFFSTGFWRSPSQREEDLLPSRTL